VPLRIDSIAFAFCWPPVRWPRAAAHRGHAFAWREPPRLLSAPTARALSVCPAAQPRQPKQLDIAARRAERKPFDGGRRIVCLQVPPVGACGLLWMGGRVEWGLQGDGWMPSQSCAQDARRLVLAGLAAMGLDDSAFSQDLPPENFRIAFIGDQGLGADAEAVLQLILAEGADAVVHSGDFDYEDDPAAWEAQINDILGADFPYFASAGNHDDSAYYGGGGYQSYLEARMKRLGIPWEGDLGVQSAHEYGGVFFVLTAPDVFGDGDSEHAPYIRDRLAEDDSAWRVSSWHVLMRAMQVGGKSDQSGWGVYEESRRGGAVVATAHEHSYARTHPLRNCELQTVDSFENTFEIRRDDPATVPDEGVSFVFHSGLAGKSIRDQERCLPTTPPYGCQGEWASIYTSDQGAQFGALFGVFHHAGDPCLARFYFKDIDGNVPDEFFVRSTLGPCAALETCPADLDGDGVVRAFDLITLLVAWGPCEGPCAADLDGDGDVGMPDLLEMLVDWGPCG
jgi:hypothetical protein